MDFLAIDPENFGEIAFFPSGISSIPMEPILTVLQSAESDAIPIVLSYDAPPRGAKIGDLVQYRVGAQEYEFEVRGIIIDFPTVTNPFVLTPLSELENRVDLAARHWSLEESESCGWKLIQRSMRTL